MPPGMYARVLQIEGVEDYLAFSASSWCATWGSGSHLDRRSARKARGLLRWCFAASEDKLADGVARLKRALR